MPLALLEVSDCPHLLSKAFRLKFDLQMGQLGYVTPSWVSEEELQSLPKAVQEAYAAGYTVNYLPLRPGTAESVELALKDVEDVAESCSG